MSNISAKKAVAGDRWTVDNGEGTLDRARGRPVDSDSELGTSNLKLDKEKLLVSMKEKAMILRHLQEKDLVQDADATELREILADLDKTIKELETSNV